MQFNNISTAQGVDHIFRQLGKEEILYANDPERGEYRGFSALHDLLDANMLLPFANEADINEEYINFCNAVMEQFNETLLEGNNSTK